MMIPSTMPDTLSDSCLSSVTEGNDHEDPIHGEQSLWRAVITQALIDAGSNSQKMSHKVERARAISWLSSRSKDFMTVCALADLDPQYVFSKAKEAMARNCQWRKPQ
jgi:hypothetical protein